MSTGDANTTLKAFLDERLERHSVRCCYWGVSVREEEMIESIYKESSTYRGPGFEGLGFKRSRGRGGKGSRVEV